MKEPKPIFVVHLHNQATRSEMEGVMAGLEQSRINEDYHVIVTGSKNSEDTYCKIYSVKDVEQATIDELRQQVLAHTIENDSIDDAPKYVPLRERKPQQEVETEETQVDEKVKEWNEPRPEIKGEDSEENHH